MTLPPDDSASPIAAQTADLNLTKATSKMRLPWLGRIQVAQQDAGFSPSSGSHRRAGDMALEHRRLLSVAVALDMAATGLEELETGPAILVAFAQALLEVRRAGGDRSQADTEAKMALRQIAHGPGAATRCALADLILTTDTHRQAGAVPATPGGVATAATRLVKLAAVMTLRAEFSLMAQQRQVQHQA